MLENSIIFGNHKSLVGICTNAEGQDKDISLPAIILLNAGILHRVGPNRFHVKLARKMAEYGFTVLRFDQSGKGDSETSKKGIEFEEQTVCDTRAAMDYLSFVKNIDRFILIGICSGADYTVNVAYRDERVVGIIGINGYYLDNAILESMSSDITASIQGRYYRKNLFNIKSWMRFISGKSNICKIWHYVKTKIEHILKKEKQKVLFESDSTILKLLKNYNMPVLLVYSEGSSAWDTFQMVIADQINNLSGDKPVIKTIDKTDHVFALLESQSNLLDTVYQWVMNEERSWIIS